MAIKDLTTTQLADGDTLSGADYNNTLDTKQSFTYCGAANTVLSGLTLAGTGAQTITVAAGYYVGSDGKSRYYAGSTPDLSAANGSNPRYDLISITDAGVITVTDGTAAAEASAVLPSTPASETVLGYVYRATSDNTTVNSDVGDMRIMWSPVCDRLFQRTMTAYASGQYIRIPLYNNDYTYYKILIEDADSADTQQSFDIRFNLIAGASTYLYDVLWYDYDAGGSVFAPTGFSDTEITFQGANGTANMAKSCWEGTITIRKSATDADLIPVFHFTSLSRGINTTDRRYFINGSMAESVATSAFTSMSFAHAQTPDWTRITLYGYR